MMKEYLIVFCNHSRSYNIIYILMKKLFFASLAVTSIIAFAYTQTDVDNATYLAGKGIITAQSTTTGYRLDDTITRAEVAGIALKLRGTTLPEGYTCKKYF